MLLHKRVLLLVSLFKIFVPLHQINICNFYLRWRILNHHVFTSVALFASGARTQWRVMDRLSDCLNRHRNYRGRLVKPVVFSLRVQQLDLYCWEPFHVLFNYSFEFFNILGLFFKTSLKPFSNHIACKIVFDFVSYLLLFLTYFGFELFQKGSLGFVRGSLFAAVDLHVLLSF